eukprot:m.59512 g.59512  ORF g.59512 m.59512 type:complete len:121 (+) comp9467_c0_seq1:3909-4271(+)
MVSSLLQLPRLADSPKSARRLQVSQSVRSWRRQEEKEKEKDSAKDRIVRHATGMLQLYVFGPDKWSKVCKLQLTLTHLCGRSQFDCSPLSAQNVDFLNKSFPANQWYTCPPRPILEWTST